ncbi:hypothetical protein BOX15_Mlig007735g1 [Macrostomum lignano]|uniref:Uncharacterized protein n=1 Tax=Macrostomum lignano TaxID=282301 RepID=A0A267E0F6_9PLAT|nr:hypothetical protein BOX15_Mlig007735g1 [Macrostomum lignano]
MSQQPDALAAVTAVANDDNEEDADVQYLVSFYANLDRAGGRKLMRVLSQQAEAAVSAADSQADDCDASQGEEDAADCIDADEEDNQPGDAPPATDISDDDDIWYLFEDDGRPRKLSRRQKKHRRMAAGSELSDGVDASVRSGHVTYSDVDSAPPKPSLTVKFLHVRQTRAGLWSPLSLMDLCLQRLSNRPGQKRPVQLPRPLLRRLQRERLLRRLRELTRQWWRERAQDLNQVMQMRNVDVAQALRSHCGRNAEEIFLSRSLYSASHYNCQHETVVHSQGAYAAEAYRMPALLRAWSSRGDTCRYLPIFHQPRFYCTSNYVLKLAFSCFPIASLACLAALEFNWRRRCIRSEGVCHELANHYGKHALPYCLWARGLVDEACSAFLATSDLLGPGIDRASMLNEVARMYAMVDMPQDAASFYLMALRELMAAGALSDSLSFEPADDRLIRIGAHFQQLALCATVFDEGQFKTGCGAVARQRWLRVFTQRFAWKPEPGPSEPAWAPFIDTEAIQAAIQLGNLSDGQVDADSYAASIEQSGAGVSQQEQQQQREERPPQQPTAPIECGLRALISLVFVHCGDGADWCRETLVHLDRLHEFTNLTSIYQSMLHAVLGERRAAIDYARDAIWLLRSLAPLIGREENDQFNEPQPGLDVSQLAAQLWQPLLDQISFHGRLPSPMRLAWRRSLSAPLLPTAVRESEETQQFAWLVGDDCSESLNLRLDSEGYLTGDVQLLAPRVPRIRLEPLTGRLLLKGYGGGGGGSSDSPCWLEPPVGADCSKSKRLESDEPRQLVLRAPCGREFTYCYSGYARLKHGCRLDTLYSVSDSGEVWRESPIKLIRRHLFKENLELLRKRSPRLFKGSKKAAELFSANPHLWDAAEKALSTLYHRQAILTASELVLKIRDYHAALQRHKKDPKVGKPAEAVAVRAWTITCTAGSRS